MADNNTEMKEFVEEYEKQIELMKKQYGQEEDLYPWIYMLLMKSGKVDNLSMRQVAGAPWAGNVLGREMFRGYVGFPDIAIVDKDFCSINISKTIENKKKYIANWISGGLKFANDSHFVNDILLKNMKNNDELKEFLRNYWYLHNIDKIRGCVEVKKLEKNLVDIEKALYKLKINHKQNEWTLTCNENVKKYSILNGGKVSDEGQLLGELLWYGKVLYTNGEVWKYLEVTKCSKDGIINDIVDLRKILYGTCVKFQEPLENWYKRISVMQKKRLEIKINCETKSDTEDLMAWIKDKVNF